VSDRWAMGMRADRNGGPGLPYWSPRFVPRERESASMPESAPRSRSSWPRVAVIGGGISRIAVGVKFLRAGLTATA
jgi:hypothetical protein